MQKIKQFLLNKRVLFILIVLIIAAIGVIWWWMNNNNSSSNRYITATVNKTSIAKTVSVVGNVTADRQQTGTFSASSTSTVTEIDAKVGDTVKAGQILAKIDSSDLQNKVDTAQNSLNQAYNNKNNTLVKGKYTTYDIDNLNVAISTAQSNLNLARKNLDAATLRAEFDGVVVGNTLVVGDAAGTTSMIVIDPTSFYISASLGEFDVINLKAGMAANITFEALDNKSYVGKISEISLSPTITSNVVTYPAKIAIVANDGQLRLGYSGQAVVTLDSKDNVLVVPTAAIKTNATGNYVQVMKNGAISNVDVQVGLVGDTETEITSGLNENDVVVVSVVTTTSSTANQGAGAIQFGAGAGGAVFRNGAGTGGGAGRTGTRGN